VAQWIAGTAACLGAFAFVARMVMRVQSGAGLVPYTSLAGLEAYPLGVLILFTIVGVTAVLGKLLGWWSSAGEHRGRRKTGSG
jgi:hypothetical protein